MLIGKKKSRRYDRRALILGDSHSKGIAGEVQHRLGKSSGVKGIMKPVANMEDIANTASLTVRLLTKKDGEVPVIFAKNESENGLGQMNRLLCRLTHTSVVVINLLHRYDLMEWACVNNRNRKLRKHIKAYDNLEMIEVENLRGTLY
jgi:hypothetical protein